MTSPACTHDLQFKTGVTNSDICNGPGSSTGVCGETMDFINFYYMEFCWFDGNPFLFLMIMAVIIFLIFRYLSTVVDEYIADGIEKISDALGQSEALAAVTLLALANGAGDAILLDQPSGYIRYIYQNF